MTVGELIKKLKKFDKNKKVFLDILEEYPEEAGEVITDEDGEIFINGVNLKEFNEEDDE